jgi:indole-3-glycerol phosphate synthase/phosphoribosylanthranilate isomerase/anthranilate synthase/indole-3-glycerol phosphate synthase/phosphoribosylanthranilate isomerase
MSETFLERIVAVTRAELAERQACVPLDTLRALAAAAPAPRLFAAALRPAPRGPVRLIAEIKRASPSKGLLAPDFDPVARARAYAAGGAAAISVLTEPHFFLGALDHLTAVRTAVDLPVLRKDFVLEPYQVYEARAAGADAVLLICALLDDAALAAMLALTHSLGMEALVEAHDGDEARCAVAAGAHVIGVNSRDLRTFAVDTDVVRHLRPLVPADRIFVAESGIADATGAARARYWGADAILVGEALMKSLDPAGLARSLSNAPRVVPFDWRAGPFIKICGLTRPEHGALMLELGVDAYGLVFAASHRRVSVERAREIVQAATFVADEDHLPCGGTWVSTPSAVGVFVNQPVESIETIARAVGLEMAQLSGDETPEQCAEVAARARLGVIKAVRLRDESDLETLDAYALAGVTLLLDAHAPGLYGGSGQISDWELARRAAERWPVILAGGLTQDNVADAIATVHPNGVDVSSGVESNKVKDPEKIRAFVAAARAAAEASEPVYR